MGTVSPRHRRRCARSNSGSTSSSASLPNASDLEATAPMFDQVAVCCLCLASTSQSRRCARADESVRGSPTEGTARPEATFGRVARNLGAVGFFVESLARTSIVRAACSTLTRRPGCSPPTSRSSTTRSAVDADDTVTARNSGPCAVEHAPPENVETSAAQHLERFAGAGRTTGGEHGDSAVLEGLSRLLPQMANEADLLDDAKLKDRIARGAVLLTRSLR